MTPSARPRGRRGFILLLSGGCISGSPSEPTATLCETWQDAQAYGRNNNSDGRQILYEVRIEDANTNTHLAWISHLAMQSGGSFLDQMEPKAHAYWSGQQGGPSQGQELLVAGPVRILRRI